MLHNTFNKMKTYTIIIEGTEYGASGHDLSKKEFDSLKTNSSDLSDIQTVIAEYDPWNTNFWSVSKPLKDAKLAISLLSENGGNIWGASCNEFNDIYDHSEKFPDIMLVDFWDEFVFNGEAVCYDKHPYILYYQELNEGILAKLIFDSVEAPKPQDFSIVFGTIETEDDEFEYIEKIYFKDELLPFEEINWDLKEIQRIFKVYG